jgi:ankyrin repeat protein
VESFYEAEEEKQKNLTNSSLFLQKGFTPLHEAARHGHVKTVELLLHHYPSPDPPGKVGLIACGGGGDGIQLNVILLRTSFCSMG